MKILGGRETYCDENKIKKNSNPKYGDVYEMRADKGHARLMFFYDIEEESIIICTNHFWKGKGLQDTAFKKCAEFKELYLATKETSR